MNRRSILQALGLAPLVALLPEASAQAGTSRDEFTVKDEAFDEYVREVFEKKKQAEETWNERKLFTVIVQVKPGDVTYARQIPVKPGRVKNIIEWEPEVIYQNLAKLIRSVTKTPDITKPALLFLRDENGLEWGGNGAQCAPKMIINISDLFLRGASTLRRAVHLRANGILRLQTAQGWNPNTAQESFDQTLIRRIDEGGVNEVIKGLASMELTFGYYGPPPYPTGPLRFFDHETGTWKHRILGEAHDNEVYTYT